MGTLCKIPNGSLDPKKCFSLLSGRERLTWLRLLFMGTVGPVTKLFYARNLSGSPVENTHYPLISRLETLLLRKPAFLLFCSLNRLGRIVLLCVLNKVKGSCKQITSWAIISVLKRRMREMRIPFLFSGSGAQLRQRMGSSVNNILLYFIIFFDAAFGRNWNPPLKAQLDSEGPHVGQALTQTSLVF